MPVSCRHFILFLILLVSASAHAQLTCDFSSNVTVGCPPLVVQFTANVSGGSNYTYSWNLGNSTTVTPATNNAPSTTYTAPGTYTVSLTVYSGSSSASKTKTAYIIVRDTPLVNFSASPLTGCPPLSVGFTNTTIAGGTGSNTYKWYFGDGSPFDPSMAPTHSYNNATAATKCHTVTLNVVNSYGCSGTKSSIPNYVCVYPKPVINFSAPNTNFCSTPATAVFTATATGIGPFTYSWDFGDGPPLGMGNPVSHQYSGALGSTYTVKLTVTDANGCQEVLTKTAYIKLIDNNSNFTAPASACVYTPVTFTGSGSPALSGADWKFNDPQNGTATGLSPTYMFSTPGTYNVRMIGYVAGCPDTVYKQIIIHPQPNVDFTINPANPCSAPQSIQFNPSPTTGITNYLWDFGVAGPVTSTSSNPTYTYQNNCFYTPTLIVTNNNGCKDTIQKSNYVRLYDLVVTAKANNHDEDSGCIRPIQFTVRDSTHCPGPGLSPYPYSVASCLWDFGNSVFSTAINPIYTYPDTGVYRVIVTVTTSNGCVGKDTLIVKVGVKCTPYFYALGDTQICNKTTVCFLDTSTSCPITQMRWEVLTYDTVVVVIAGIPYRVPHVTSSSVTQGLYNPFCYNFKVSDTHTVTLVTYHHGCPTDTFKRYRYIVVDSPTARFTVAYSCDTPLKIKFYNKSIGATSWTWHFGDNTISADTNPEHFYSTYGTYTPYITTHNSRTGCRDTFSYVITLTNPSVAFSASDTTLCFGDTVNLSGALIGGIAAQYNWFVDNSFLYAGFGNSYQWPLGSTAPGYHSMRLVIVDNHDCRDTLTKPNYIFVSKPVAADTAVPTSGCLPVTINFTDLSTTTTGATITNRLWYYGTGSPVVVSGTSSSYNYTAVGDYDIKLVITDNIGCKDSVTKPKYVQIHKPVAGFYVKDTGCVKENILFSNTSSPIDSSFWDFGDNTTSKSFQPTHAYNAVGSYTVRLIVKDTYGCRDTITKVAKVNIIKPTANFTMSDSVAVCAPLTVNFTNTSVGAYSYYWVLGSGNTSTLKNATEIYIYPGIYNIKLVVTNTFGCTDTIVKQVKILGYAGAFSYTPLSGCKPLEVFFTPQVANVANLVWDFNDGTTLSTSGFGTISHIYNTPGSYVPKIVITDGTGCKASSLGIDTIKVDAGVAGFKTSPACEYGNVDFIDTSWGYFSTPASWYWVFHDGSISGKQNPKFTYGPAGKYSVKLVMTTNKGCKDSIIQDLIINKLPEIDAGRDTIICLKDSAMLMPNGGVSYVWSPATYLSCTACTNPLAYPPIKYKYTVVGTDINGCTNTDTTHVGIKFKVESDVGPGGEVCDLDSFQLEVKGGRTYVWSPIDWLTNNKIANPIATPHNTIKYKVVAYEGSCIPDTNFVDITVRPLPTVKASGEQTIIAGNTAVIQASGDLIKKFMWSPAENLSCSDCADPTAKPTKTTVYTIVVYSEYGCTDTDRVTIKVLCDESQLFIPNTFTPNGDGQNDVFYPRGNGIEKVRSFRVYNRWGEVVYEKTDMKVNDQSLGWDGNRNGTQLPPDVFVYVVDAQCDNGESMTIKGDVTLIR